MTEEEEYDKAFSDMSAEPLELDETQPPRKKAWRNSQKYRRDRLREAAQILGFDTIDQLCKSIMAMDANEINQMKALLQ